MLPGLKNVLVPTLAAAWVGFIAGGFIGSSAARHEGARKLAEAQREAAENALKLSENYKELERQNAKTLSNALAARDRALADADAMRADAERVRRAAARYRAGVSAAAGKGAGAGDADRAGVARCVELLSESAGLLAEGDRMARKLNADRDALAELAK